MVHSCHRHRKDFHGQIDAQNISRSSYLVSSTVGSGLLCTLLLLPRSMHWIGHSILWNQLSYRERTAFLLKHDAIREQLNLVRSWPASDTLHVSRDMAPGSRSPDMPTAAANRRTPSEASREPGQPSQGSYPWSFSDEEENRVISCINFQEDIFCVVGGNPWQRDHPILHMPITPDLTPPEQNAEFADICLEDIWTPCFPNFLSREDGIGEGSSWPSAKPGFADGSPRPSRSVLDNHTQTPTASPSAQPNVAISAPCSAPDTPTRSLLFGIGHNDAWAQNVDPSPNPSSETYASGDEESNLDEPLWIPSSFQGRPSSVASNSLIELERLAIQAVIDAYLQSQGSNGQGGGDATSVPSSSPENSSEQKSNKNKRSFNSCQSRGETEQGGPATKKCRTVAAQQQVQVRLACPFQKKDPERYPHCGIRERGWQTIGHVKQHLKRSHARNPNYCPRCMCTFSSELEKNAHIMEAMLNPCEMSSLPLPEGLSPELLSLLGGRVGKGIGVEEQWYSVWDLIFPGVTRPATCTFDLTEDMAAQTLGLCTFLEREGPSILTSYLAERNIAMMEASLEAPFNFDEAAQRRVISEAFRQIVMTWRRDRPRRGDGEEAPRGTSLPTPASPLEEQSQNDDSARGTSQRDDTNFLGFDFDIGSFLDST